jgi:hypothetical protein
MEPTGGFLAARISVVGRKRVKARYLGSVVGIGAHLGHLKLEDPFTRPDGQNLQGRFGLATAGLDYWLGKFDLVVFAVMGEGWGLGVLEVAGGGSPAEPNKLGRGLTVVAGAAAMISQEQEECCSE